MARLLEDPNITRIRSVARRPLDAWAARPKLVHTQADLRDDGARRALEGVDVLWHLGFALWRDGDGAHLNLDGTRNILAARPGRIVLASTVALYGAWPDNPIPLTETHWPRPNPECSYASQKLTAERLCRQAAPTAALRLAAVLGPHAAESVQQATLGYRRAVPAIRGVTQAIQFLDEDDAACALHLAGLEGESGVFNIAPRGWLSEEDISRIAGGRVVRLRARALLRTSELAFRLGLLPFGADRAVLINGPLAVDGSRATEVLGWRATRRSDEVLAAALARG